MSAALLQMLVCKLASHFVWLRDPGHEDWLGDTCHVSRYQFATIGVQSHANTWLVRGKS